ncbi:MAG: lactonase family protein [Enterococcus sp.]
MLEKILLGTYTRQTSQGIYQVLLDTEKQELTNLTLVTKETSPTYLAQSQAQNLYTVTAVDGQGGCGAYDAQFQLINTVTKDGAPLCYVAVDEARQLVYGANYHLGEVTVYQIEPNGAITLCETIRHTDPTGTHPNQNSAHVHYTDLTPDQRLVVCDLGTDRVYTYDVSTTGKLSEVAQYQAEDQTGPRHLVFHPNQKTAYLFGELDSTITVLNYDQTTGRFAALQKISTLPAGFEGENGGAALRVTKDGQFLYASNRGHNSIVAYAIDEHTQQLTLIQHSSTHGDHPRDFALNDSDDFLVCANQTTNNLTLYRRDLQTGLLSLCQKDFTVPEAVCVLFT